MVYNKHGKSYSYLYFNPISEILYKANVIGIILIGAILIAHATYIIYQQINESRKESKMDKKIIYLLFMIITILSGCANNTVNDVTYISEQIGIDISGSEIIEKTDTHGGFHGDGKLIVQVEICNKNFEQELKETGKWSQEPSELTEILLYGNEEWNPYIADDNGEPLMKKIENGYYFIINNTDSNNEDIEWSEMYSINAIVAVYDVDNNILYYYEIDT